MEHFKGSLAHYRLQLLMPALFDASAPVAEGILRLERGAVLRRFYFRDGLLVGESSSEPGEHLAQVLANLRILDAERAAAAFEAAETGGVPFGTYLVDRGLVELPRLLEALEHKAREALFDCYAWESGEAEFTPGRPELPRAVSLRLSLASLHRDALARLAEWRTFRDIFPAQDTTFRVFQEVAVEADSDEADVLLQLAERGATLSELLASVREGPLAGARLLMHLYRRGALAPKRPRGGTRMGEAMQIEELIATARRCLETGRADQAVALAAQILERAPVPEAHALYREAEVRLSLALADELFQLDGRLHFEPIPRPPPATLTADDLYLYSKLRGSRSVRQALRSAAMGELAASRSMHRLMGAGLIRVAGGPAQQQAEADSAAAG